MITVWIKDIKFYFNITLFIFYEAKSYYFFPFELIFWWIKFIERSFYFFLSLKKTYIWHPSYKLTELNSSFKKCNNYNSFFASFNAALIYSKWIFNGRSEYARESYFFVAFVLCLQFWKSIALLFFNQTAKDICSNMTVLEHMKVTDNADLK